MGMMFHRYSLRNRVIEKPKPEPAKPTVEVKAEPVSETVAEPVAEPMAEQVEAPKKEYRKPYQRGRKHKS